MTKKPRKPASRKPSERVMMLPARIAVGPFNFAVKLWSETEAMLHSAAGMCDQHRNLILIKEGMNAQTTAEVLLHEVLHAIFYTSGLPMHQQLDEHEEAIVNQLAIGLLGVIRHNPNFMPLLKQLLDRDQE